MKYEIVLWDVDGTLLDQTIPERKAIRKALLKLGLGDCTEEDLDRYPYINTRWWGYAERGEKEKSEIVWRRFEEFLTFAGKDPSFARDMNLLYMESLGDTITFIPYGKEVLSILQGKVKQYVVTNGYRLSQKKKLDNSGIIHMVDRCFISEDVGFDKPKKEFFDIVLNEVDCKDRRNVLLVGDNLITDMTGGINAGVSTCLYDRSRKNFNSGLKIDYEIDNLMIVPSIVGII